VNLSKADLSESKLNNSDLFRANLSSADLHEADLSEAKVKEADLSRTNLRNAALRGADLTRADLRLADLFSAALVGAKLDSAKLVEAKLSRADFTEANLTEAKIIEANLAYASLVRANMARVDLTGTNLYCADLTEADLKGANLTRTALIHTKINKAKVSLSSIHGINVWDLEGEFEEQKDLVISRKGQPVITVDNIEVAQFIYLILNNEKIRGVINTLTSRSVLILGRFSIEERKTILDALRNKLREFHLLPIVFDFDRPTDKDFTETIKTLAGLSYFVIADVTNPKSSPLELQATVPDYQIPFVPIIQEGENPFAMMVDLQKKYNWVLNTVSYDSQETLMKVLKPLIIDPAMKKRQELRILKAQEPEIISAKDFLARSES
jgi:uncharacterized protein YjbI with pentapeptide repeats